MTCSCKESKVCTLDNENIMVQNMVAQKDSSIEPRSIPLKGMVYRFIVRGFGDSSFVIRSVKSLEDSRCEIEVSWLKSINDVPPLSYPFSFGVSLIDALGNELNTYSISFEDYEILPFNLDYCSSDSLSYKYILKRVSYSRVQ